MFNRIRSRRTLPTSMSNSEATDPDSMAFHEWAAQLGHRLAEAGARPVEADLVALAQVARRHQMAAVSASVLADRHQPEVARARAFARVLIALSAVVPPAHHESSAAA